MVRVCVRVTGSRIVDTFDNIADTIAAEIGNDLWAVSEPLTVRQIVANDQGGAAVAGAPTNNLISRITRGVSRLDSDPRVHTECAAPPVRTCRVHLDDSFSGCQRIGSKSSRRAAGRTPIISHRTSSGQYNRRSSEEQRQKNSGAFQPFHVCHDSCEWRAMTMAVSIEAPYHRIDWTFHSRAS